MEQQSDLTGATWTTVGQQLRIGSGCSSIILKRNTETHHADLTGSYSVITDGSGIVQSSSLNDQNGVLRFTSGVATTPWRWNQSEEEGLTRIGNSDYLPERNLRLQIFFSPQQAQKRNCSADRAICVALAIAGGALCVALQTSLLTACLAVCALDPEPVTKFICINICRNLLLAKVFLCISAAATAAALCQAGYIRCVKNGGIP